MEEGPNVAWEVLLQRYGESLARVGIGQPVVEGSLFIEMKVCNIALTLKSSFFQLLGLSGADS